MEKYNVNDHGDLLEKEATSFIRNKIPYYETVWQTYIGNVGDASIAPLPNYPREQKRVSFSEHSYTVLEASFMIQVILETHTLDLPLDSFKNYFEFNKTIIFYFTCLGRIHDNIIKAAEDLNIQTDRIRDPLNEFYQARNIVIHGKRIPIEIDEFGLIKIPTLENINLSQAGWSDKRNNWSDLAGMHTNYAVELCGKYFDDLMTEINNIYANFLNVIIRELKDIPTSLTFIRNKVPQDIFHGALPPSSGSTRVSTTGLDVYRLKESMRPK
jgi:hypothetical protein